MKVRFLRRDEIEFAALSTLAAYERQFEKIVDPPIPVEEILECHLQLVLRFEDLVSSQSAPDALGAIWMHQREVSIDESLDPTVFPQKEGRYRFTLGHETGHWQLHRHLFLADTNQYPLFGASPEPSIVCRAGSSKDPIEWQADAFASHLLMPKEIVIRVWEEVYGTSRPYFAAKEMASLAARRPSSEGWIPAVEAAREMARRFKVSAQAMQIRLVGLKLIRDQDRASSLFGWRDSR
jgi:Zn-dependent peptidase ImmA (M78 family)